jgi:hypothetical protein
MRGLQIELTSPAASEQSRADCEAICKLGLKAKVKIEILGDLQWLIWSRFLHIFDAIWMMLELLYRPVSTECKFEPRPHFISLLTAVAVTS